MSLQNIPLQEVGETEIQRLIAMGVAESLYLDYKQETYGDSGNDRSEFLADISSFANTLGGDLVIGVAEDNGFPVRLTPFQGDCDTEKRRLEQIALSGLEPRIPNLRVHSLPIESGGHVIVVRVPRSFIPPHRVIARDSNRFWARAGTTKYQPNVEQLRRLFNDAPQISNRVRGFQTDRLVKITAGETPIPMNAIGKVVVHVIPVPAFADGRMIDIVSILNRHHLPTPLDALNLPAGGSVNLDGYVNSAIAVPGQRQAYAQFFRNGSIEGVGELRSDDRINSRFIGGEFTHLIVTHVQQYLEVAKFYELGLPIYVFLSLCCAKETVYRYASPEGFGWQETKSLGREFAAFPEIYVDDFAVDVAAALRPVFNVVWNAFGLPQCEIYDEKGNWRGVS